MSILYPAFALFALTMFCVMRLGFSRYRAVSSGRVDGRYFRDYRGYDEPEDLRIQSRHVVNLLEIPVLFYTITVIAFVTNATGTTVVALCWLYVGLRYVHSYIHLTSNQVLWRFRIFGISVMVLTVLWAVVLAKLLQ